MTSGRQADQRVSSTHNSSSSTPPPQRSPRAPYPHNPNRDPAASDDPSILLLGPVTALACGHGRLHAQPRGRGVTSTVQAHTLTRTPVPTIVHDLVVRRIDPARLARSTACRSGARIRPDTPGLRRSTSACHLLRTGLLKPPTGVARMRTGEAGATAPRPTDIQVEPDGEITLASTAPGPWANTWQGALGYLGEAGASSRLWRHNRLHTGDAEHSTATGTCS